MHVITGIFACITGVTGVASAYEQRLTSECASAACVLQDDPVSVSSPILPSVFFAFNVAFAGHVTTFILNSSRFSKFCDFHL